MLFSKRERNSGLHQDPQCVCVVVLVENLKRLKRNFEVGRSMFLKNGFKDRDWIWATQNLDVELRGDFLLYNSDFAFFLKFVRGAF